MVELTVALAATCSRLQRHADSVTCSLSLACRFKSGSVFEQRHWKHDVSVVEKALEIVTRFNEGSFINKPIKVNRAMVWEEKTTEVKEKFLVEPFIEHWEKWNSNTGWALGDDEWSDIMQALSHFSFHTTKGQLVLCDLQGGIFEDDAVISDPVILSRKRMYGSVDTKAALRAALRDSARFSDALLLVAVNPSSVRRTSASTVC